MAQASLLNFFIIYTYIRVHNRLGTCRKGDCKTFQTENAKNISIFLHKRKSFSWQRLGFHVSLPSTRMLFESKIHYNYSVWKIMQTGRQIDRQTHTGTHTYTQNDYYNPPLTLGVIIVHCLDWSRSLPIFLKPT